MNFSCIINNHPIIKDINTIKLSDNIIHVAKSPKYNFDIYGEYVVKEYNFLWNIETLIKGNLIETNCNIKDIKKLCFEGVTFEDIVINKSANFYLFK